jgi:hypothetical protein
MAGSKAEQRRYGRELPARVFFLTASSQRADSVLRETLPHASVLVLRLAAMLIAAGGFL